MTEIHVLYQNISNFHQCIDVATSVKDYNGIPLSLLSGINYKDDINGCTFMIVKSDYGAGNPKLIRFELQFK